MGTLLDLASLVTIPSGYKVGTVYSVVPTDGAGDLTFTRSNDTATRVGPNGLIEKVRTNQILQSNTFNVTWSTTTASVTGGQAGYDGTNNAWLVTKSGASGRVTQSFTASAGLTTFSVYAKANASTYIAIEFNTSYIYVNLTNGAQGSTGPGTYKIDSIGNGWYRISMTTANASSVFRIYPAENNDLSATTGSIYIQNAQIESGDIATDYIATTTTTVSVGPVANLPRLDYLNSTCPNLLLEPQRTNGITYSEQFNNATWELAGSSVTANNAVSPDGYTNADLLTADGGNSIHDIYESFSGGLTNSVSVFVKKGTARYINIVTNYTSTGNDWVSVVFDLDTLTTNIDQSGDLTSSSVQIVSYGNGWYRLISNTNSASATTLYAFYGIVGQANPSRGVRGRVVLTSSATINLYGAQAEVGSYATSYIPTLGASSTRGADATYELTSSALIGQTEGTFFVQFKGITSGGVGASRFSISDGTSANWIFIGTEGNNLRGYVRASSTVLLSNTSITTTGNDKIAIGYKSGNIVLYINGNLIASDTSTFAVSSTLDEITTGVAGSYTVDDPIGLSELLVFPTRLSNAELAQLTTL